MNLDALNKLLKAEPFQPFRLELSSGAKYTVHHPEFVIPTKSFVVVYEPDDERVGHLSYLHIAQAEILANEPQARSA